MYAALALALVKQKQEKLKKEKEMSDKILYSKWLKRGPNTFIPTDDSEIVYTVEPGYYEIHYSQTMGYYLFKKRMHLDELIEFPSAVHQKVLNSIKHFWERKAKFKEYGFAFKRGVLLHGKPGCGKTGIINLSVKYVIENLNGIVLSINSTNDLEHYAKFIPEIFRIIEPDRSIVVIFEDVESICYQNESLLLNVLDGLDQLENVVYLATTNYIEKLKERIINRPSRFDRRIYMPYLDAADRKFFFEKKLKPNDLKAIDLNTWVKDTDKMSIAHLAELIKSVIIFGNTYEEGLELLKDMNDMNALHSSQYEKSTSKVGFGINAPKSDQESSVYTQEVAQAHTKYPPYTSDDNCTSGSVIIKTRDGYKLLDGKSKEEEWLKHASKGTIKVLKDQEAKKLKDN